MSGVVTLGWVAALLTTVLGMPQAIRLLRTRDTHGLSLIAWQAMLGINIGWTSHGLVIGQANMIVPNALALSSTLPVLALMAQGLRRPLLRVLAPGLALGAAMIAVDLLLGTTAYGLVATVPSLVANAGQSLELVRAPVIRGVSPVFLVFQVLCQGLWLSWAVLVPEWGTIITAAVTLVVVVFNLGWWVLRTRGLRPFLLSPGADPIAATPGPSSH